jgi:3-oxoacyl-[acyl-carrier-protein] synthase II
VRRVAVTGLAAITAAGAGPDTILPALRGESPLGTVEEIALARGRRARVRVARLPEIDPGSLIPAGALRRMSPESRAVVWTCLMAVRDAGAENRAFAPERTGTFTGSGFGCIRTTAEYLDGIFREGLAAASPLLFAESLASAPLGHAAIALGARGTSLAFVSGDASMTAALGAAWRAVRAGRVDRAVCVSFELMPLPLLPLLARLAARRARGREIFVGEGLVALVLEDLDRARASGARVHAELIGVGSEGDPAARPTDWSHDVESWAGAHARALRHAEGAARRIGRIFRHGPPSPGAAQAESRAIERLAAGSRPAEILDVHAIFGAHAAAGGISVAAAALSARSCEGLVLVSAGSWGGATSAAVIGAPPA